MRSHAVLLLVLASLLACEAPPNRSTGASNTVGSDDGNPEDAGSVDAGADAGPDDAGPADAGIDAGPGDGGTAVVTGRPAPVPANYELAWRDDFDEPGLDKTKWTAIYPGLHRDGYNTPAAVSLEGGIVSITTFTEAGVHYSALLSTMHLYEPMFGYFEARIRFNDSPGGWCAFWLQGETNGNPVGDPGRAGVEIDVVEHRATDGSGSDLGNVQAINLNWDGYGPGRLNVQKLVAGPASGPSLQGFWHVYGLLWTANEYVFYLDDKPVWTTNSAISRRTESLWLTCEVQTSTWSGSVPPSGYGSLQNSTTRMDVDWVRVWQPR
jgi:glycosyl hydrolase family 16